MEIKTKNQAYFRGRIINKFRQPDGEWLAMRIAINTKEKVVDMPRIYWFGNQIDEVDQAYEPRDWVTIQASFRYNPRFRENILVGEKIAHTPRELMQKFGIDNLGPYLEDFNEVQILGTISNIHIPENRDPAVALVSIRTEVNDVPHVSQVSCFRHQYDKVTKMQVGDTVCMLGHIQTRRLRREGRTLHYQSVVCHLIEKVEATQEQPDESE